MSRSGFMDYDDGGDYPNLDQGRYNAWRNAAFKGRRGQAFLRELRDALEAMSEKRLIADELIKDGEVCAIGALGRARGIQMDAVDPQNPQQVGKVFDIPTTLVREIVFANDDDFKQYSTWEKDETPEQRYVRVLAWVNNEIKS